MPQNKKRPLATEPAEKLQKVLSDMHVSVMNIKIIIDIIAQHGVSELELFQRLCGTWQTDSDSEEEQDQGPQRRRAFSSRIDHLHDNMPIDGTPGYCKGACVLRWYV